MPYEYTAQVTKVIDGDTVDLKVDVGFRHHLEDRFRLYGIDAWETRGPERPRGLTAKAALIGLFEAYGPAVMLQTHKDKRGKYGRWLADLWLPSRGIHVNGWLVAEGHAIKASY